MSMDGLSAKQERIAELYAAGIVPAAIAGELSTSVTTVYKHLRNPLVKAMVSEIGGRELRPIYNELRSELLSTVRYFVQVRDDESETTRVRLSACDSIISAFDKLANRVDVLPRLAALEALAAEATDLGPRVVELDE